MFCGKKIQRKTAILLILTLLLCNVLTGCGNVAATSGEMALPMTSEMLADMEIFYMEDAEVPETGEITGTFEVFLNQIGYEPTTAKTVMVKGEKIPEQFEIVDVLTAEVIYRGSFEKQDYNEETGEYAAYGDFSDLNQEGSYFLICDDTSCSYPFEIKEGLEKELLQDAIALLLEKLGNLETEGGLDNVTEVCRALSVVLISYELFPGAYEEAGEDEAEPGLLLVLREYAEWLMTLKDTDTGVLMEEDGVLEEETAWWAAVLTKFAYTYREYDKDYAEVCLAAAEKAWKYLDKKAETVSEESLFYVAAELYRMTGKSKYHKAVKKLGAGLTPDTEVQAQVFGTLTYAATERRVDVDLCAKLMDVLFEKAQNIAAEAKADSFLTTGSMEKEEVEKLLWDMTVMSVINYIITNKEYGTVVENGFHYIAGVNAEAVCYIKDDSAEVLAEEDIGGSYMYIADYIMILSEMMSHKVEEKR